MRFSQRMGYVKVSDTIQTDGMNDDLRNSLWNSLWMCSFGDSAFHVDRGGMAAQAECYAFVAAMKKDLLKVPMDGEFPYAALAMGWIKDFFFAASWHEVYDFLEFCVKYLYDVDDAIINETLEQELSGFRMIDGVVTPVTTSEEVQAIQKAIDDSTFSGAREHIKTALILLSDKQNPDYRNSIKESISAVESACGAIADDSKASLGQALRTIGKKHPLHPALEKGFSNLYGYTCQDDGIRHGLLDDGKELTQADAIYFLVSCSAFVNYLRQLSA